MKFDTTFLLATLSLLSGVQLCAAAPTTSSSSLAAPTKTHSKTHTTPRPTPTTPTRKVIESKLELPANLTRKHVLSGQGRQVYNCQRTDGKIGWVLVDAYATLKYTKGRSHHIVANLTLANGQHKFTHDDTATPNDVSSVTAKITKTTKEFSGATNLPWALLSATSTTYAKKSEYFANTRNVIRAFTEGGLTTPKKKCEYVKHIGREYRSFFRAQYWFYE
ncbi:hypothetical protein HK105_200709 [Polyrhizophydium stewartii]|uniref:Uncharacterized protein n=1 Tax=Polyrhizophydium stewartii TaxID=2732419 RepID=A0ABR4NJS6_9FUNG|nr:hypothetical protein HK105_005249 [Polyrhizophydium stewartii]